MTNRTDGLAALFRGFGHHVIEPIINFYSMKNFHCDNCGMVIFFENDHCMKCGERLGFCPDTLEMSSEKKWSGRPGNKQVHLCANYEEHRVCNWLVAAKNGGDFCLACHLNEIIPDLAMPGNYERWGRLELAKRRCLYIYLRLGLPFEADKKGDLAPLRFRFLADMPGVPVLTGHDNGVITINIAEADGDERERRRLKLHEPYRTLVGHMRHETGHYYWDRLIAHSQYLQPFRELFGDETLDYKSAMEKYYREGPARDWEQRTVTPYASWHPWEDWAETWAHYLHMVGTLETAASFGLCLGPTTPEKNPNQKVAGKISAANRNFDQLLSDWQPMTLALNSINRTMGISDLYPFIIPPAAIEKLRFIHNLIEAERVN
jgi:hypothetical protein